MNRVSIEAIDKATGATEGSSGMFQFAYRETVEFLLYCAGKHFPSYAFDLCVYIAETQKHFAAVEPHFSQSPRL